MKWLNFLKKNKAAKRMAIMDIGDADFETQVIRRSYKAPVMVDFWAGWCVPCRQLGPVLEKVAEDPNSDFFLAKLNTEENQKTAARYSIRSIPAVKLFRNGQVVAEFTGARPEALVRRFVDKATDGEAPIVSVRANATPAQRLKQAEQHLKKGRGFEAFVLLQELTADEEEEQAAALRPLARFLYDVADGDALTGVAALDDAYLAAARALRKRNPERALTQLFTALAAGESIDRPYTQKVIESLLALLGENHTLTQKYRTQLQK